MASFHDLTTAQLKQAVQIREQIESLQEKLDALLGGLPTYTPKRKLGRPAGKRTMSAASRAKMAAGQKARWAKLKGIPSKVAPSKASVKAVPKKKVMSPEAKAKIASAMKARWEAKRASSGKS